MLADRDRRSLDRRVPPGSGRQRHREGLDSARSGARPRARRRCSSSCRSPPPGRVVAGHVKAAPNPPSSATSTVRSRTPWAGPATTHSGSNFLRTESPLGHAHASLARRIRDPCAIGTAATERRGAQPRAVAAVETTWSIELDRVPERLDGGFDRVQFNSPRRTPARAATGCGIGTSVPISESTRPAAGPGSSRPPRPAFRIAWARHADLEAAARGIPRPTNRSAPSGSSGPGPRPAIGRPRSITAASSLPVAPRRRRRRRPSAGARQHVAAGRAWSRCRRWSPVLVLDGADRRSGVHGGRDVAAARSRSASSAYGPRPSSRLFTSTPIPRSSSSPHRFRRPLRRAADLAGRLAVGVGPTGPGAQWAARPAGVRLTEPAQGSDGGSTASALSHPLAAATPCPPPSSTG